MKKLFDNIKSYIQDLKSGEKKLSKDGMLILFFSGLLIYVILLPINNNSGYKNKITETTAQEKENNQTETRVENDYQKKLEQELEEFLSKVKGIGEVEVLIYLSSSEEYIVEKDVPTSQVTTKETDHESKEENKEED